MKAEKKDHCTGFFESWVAWRWSWKPWKWWKIIDISGFCKDHDDRCGTHGFYSDLWNARVVGWFLIATIATIACWWKYTKLMWSKV